MDDKLRSQALKAVAKANVAVEAAMLELEDVLANGCGCPKTVEEAIGDCETAKARLLEAHALLRTSHIAERNATDGAPLPFPEGEEATSVPKAKAKKKKKDADIDAA